MALVPEALESKKPLEGHENRFLKKLSEASLAQAETEMNPAQTAQDLLEESSQESTPPKTALKLVCTKHGERVGQSFARRLTKIPVERLTKAARSKPARGAYDPLFDFD